jgi:serine/threonine protein kinase
MSEAASFPRVPPEVFDDPQFLKKYELERELGVGGAGAVVCARHRELDERVAIKFLLSGSENVEAVARFRREARAAHRVKNEHVVGIVDVSTTSTGVPYVVMEYLEGTDLERMLLESPDRQLPVRDAIDFVLQACEALAECHAIGIVHRDLKPSNLFCTHGADGLPIIKVLDFGISKLGTVTVDEAMTGRHAIMGSPRYMSPEQFATPQDVDRRADIWALGIILYELITGAAPFVGNTLISIWEHVKTVVPKPLEELRRDTPRGLSPIVLHCLEKDRAKRYHTVADLAKALLPLASERMRATVTRIVRIVEAPGGTTASLSLPPSARPSTGGATSVSVRSMEVAKGSTRNLTLVLVVAAGAIGLVLLLGRRTTPSKDPASPPTPTVLVQQPVSPEAHTAAITAPSAPAVAPSASIEPPPPGRAGLPPASSASSAVPAVASVQRIHSTPPRGAGEARSTAAAPLGAESAIVEVRIAREPSAASSETPRSEPAAAPSSKPTGAAGTPAASQWITDIVEQRKTKTGGSP